MNIEEKLLKGDKRGVARFITLVENKDPDAFELLKNCTIKLGMHM